MSRPSFADPFGQNFGNGGVISYGGMNDMMKDSDEVSKKIIFVPQGRSRVNLSGICVNIFLPWLVFTAIYWVMIFKIHYVDPVFAWSVVFSGLGLATIMAVAGYIRTQREAAPSWYNFAAFAFFLATGLAAFFGNMVFWTYMERYYDYMTLNTLSSVNPEKYTGGMLMDSGRVYFHDGAQLDIKKSMGFKNGDMYCVVPISNGCHKMPNYDLWAVGKNCCTNPGQFTCGDASNFRIRSALRSMELDDNPFYRLAVQQAEAAYGITATHPVFFHWTQDPLHEIMSLRKQGIKYFLMGTFSHFITNIITVLFVTFGFAKMRHHGRGDWA